MYVKQIFHAEALPRDPREDIYLSLGLIRGLTALLKEQHKDNGQLFQDLTTIYDEICRLFKALRELSAQDQFAGGVVTAQSRVGQGSTFCIDEVLAKAAQTSSTLEDTDVRPALARKGSRRIVI
jgi:hypothetical protein